MINQDKPKNNITDIEILASLRKAVLDTIGDSETGREALKKIEEKGNELSNDLKIIGRRLVRKQKALQERGEKKEKISLTQNELEKITATVKELPSTKSLIENIPKKTSVKRVVPVQTKNQKNEKKVISTPRVFKKTQNQQKQKPSIIKALPSITPMRLLPKPSFITRVTIKFSWLTAIIIIVVLIIFGGSGLLYTIYKTDVTNSLITNIAVRLRLPVGKINGMKIYFDEFNEDVYALEKFFKSDANISAYDTTNLGEIKDVSRIRELVFERYTRVLLIRKALVHYNQSISNNELASQLNEVVVASGGEKELSNIVGELYSWTTEDFTTKALLPLLEEERLALFISQDEALNSQKKILIDSIAQEIRDGKDFATAASEYSEDVTAEVAGDLDWFVEGTLLKEFEDKVLELELGGVSEPFRTIYGWHIVQLTDKDTSDPELPRYRARHILINYISLEEFVNKLQETAVIKIYKDF